MKKRCGQSPRFGLSLGSKHAHAPTDLTHCTTRLHPATTIISNFFSRCMHPGVWCDIRLCVETMLRRAMFWAKMGRSGTY
jgi:hypothetical protein